jgi:hypothetical protein
MGRGERWDGWAGVDGSGIVHDAVFVFASGIIMDDDTAHVPLDIPTNVDMFAYDSRAA